MTLSDLLTQCRDFYVNPYLEKLAELKSDNVSFMAEPLVAHRPKRDGSEVFNLPQRVDLAILDDQRQIVETCAVDPDLTASFETVKLRFTDDFIVKLRPMAWNHCEVRFYDLPEDVRWKPLAEWYNKWVDAENLREAGPDGLYGVAHYMSPPTIGSDWAQLVTIDLGSAPIRCIEHLINVAERMGAHTLQIGYRG